MDWGGTALPFRLLLLVPFVYFVGRGSDFLIMFEGVRVVRPDMRLRGLVVPFPFVRGLSAGVRIGLRERVRARLLREESEASSLESLCFSSWIVSGWGDFVRDRFAAERVK